MPKLATMRDVIGAEQDADIAVEFGFSASSGASWPSRDTVRWQIPPKIMTLALLGIDVAENRFLTDPWHSTFMDHPIADLFRRPTVFQQLNHALAQGRVTDQLAVARTSIRGHQLSGRTVVAVMFGHTLIAEVIAFEFPEDRRPATLQNACHLIDRDFCMPPAFYSTSFCDT
tara:strand:- start:457 stop:972 length:516 start_codon:yes stop_codon:yes gene_type:complete